MNGVAPVPAGTGATPGPRRLLQILIDEGRLQPETLERALRLQQEQSHNERIGSLLVKLGMLSERDLAMALSAQSGLPLIERKDYPAAMAEDLPLPPRFLRDNHVLPVAGQDGRLLLIMADPLDPYLFDAVRLSCNVEIDAAVGVPGEIDATLDEWLREQEETSAKDVETQSLDDDVEHLKELASEAPVIKLVNGLLARAVELRASDIHIEPFEQRLKIRYRVDGVLREVDSPPHRLAAAVTSRVKIMANLNIAERRLPQDGRMKRRIQGREIDWRVSTVPTLHGESLVLRLLDRGDVDLDLAALGFETDLQQKFEALLDRPHGIVLVTGPTGSGKTTTLYTALTRLNTAERKILTVEDPVEYNLEGINQIQVKPQIDLHFSTALRAIVRQDPDVIMIGEMRDQETAAIAVQSALTGHLVLSTLHTNDAAGSITRLQDMGVADYLLASTVNGILAQRLVRTLCPQCRQAYTPGPEQARRWGLDEGAEAPQRLYRAVGCEDCNGSGYRGRTTIAELMLVDEDLRESINARASAGELQKIAVRNGMQTLFRHGLTKARAGLTSLEEVARVSFEG